MLSLRAISAALIPLFSVAILAAGPGARSGEAAPAPAEMIAANAAAEALVPMISSVALHVSAAQPSIPKTASAELMLPAHPVASSESMLRGLPVIGTVQRRVGDRFNTTESSRIDAFAVCYHVSDRVGFQVIPGNPAPPRMGASYIANNTGVTVGMTLRLQRQR